MKRLIVFAVIGSLLAPPLVMADGRHGSRHHPGGRPVHSAPYYGYYYNGYPPGPYHYKHHDGNDSDEVAWAIGGLVLGAVIGSSAAKAQQAAEVEAAAVAPQSTPLPPPQKRKVVTCYDEVAYDKEGEPYVARQCYENWR